MRAQLSEEKRNLQRYFIDVYGKKYCNKLKQSYHRLTISKFPVFFKNKIKINLSLKNESIISNHLELVKGNLVL